MMKQVGNILFNIKVIESMSYDKFKELYGQAGWKASGLSLDQLAKQLGIEKEKVEKEPSK